MLDVFEKGVYAEFRNDYLPGTYDGLTKVGETTFTKIEFLEEGVEMTATADGGKYNTKICYNKDKVISVPRELVGESIVVDIRLTKDYWKKKLKVRKNVSCFLKTEKTETIILKNKGDKRCEYEKKQKLLLLLW